MKLKLSIFFLVLSFIMVGQHNFVLNGVCSKNANSKNIYLTYKVNGKSITKSSEINNNKFVFKGELAFPTRATICTDPKFNMTTLNSKVFYLEPNIMNIKLDFDNLNTIVINGSKATDEFNSLQNRAEKEKFHKKMDSIRESSRLYSIRISETSDPSLKIKFQKSLDSLHQLWDQLVDQNRKKSMQLEFEFIKKNPNSFISPDLLCEILTKEDEQIPYDTIKNLYNKLAPEVKISNNGKQLAERLFDFKNSRIGSLAPDFALKDINRNTVRLSSFYKNQYVLIDFWASWCGPCREDFPFLKEIYTKYKNKGLEFISISRDENLQSWKKTIEKEKIEIWKQISTKENKSTIEEIYVVTAIPVKILINKQGIIIGRWIGSGAENRTAIENMITEIFDK
jgi:thiol-disulfide isomerase/thioredoxin